MDDKDELAATRGWKEIDIEAYRKLLSECKDDKEFRRRLKEMEKGK